VKRREFIGLLGGAAAAWPLAARAQQPSGKLATIGFLGAHTLAGRSELVAAFMQRLREFGWIEGRTVTMKYRWGEGRAARYAEIAAEFVRLSVDVIVTDGTAAALAAKRTTTVIPIVFTVAGDRHRPVWREAGRPVPPRRRLRRQDYARREARRPSGRAADRRRRNRPSRRCRQSAGKSHPWQASRRSA
jgi:hypothetical protein